MRLTLGFVAAGIALVLAGLSLNLSGGTPAHATDPPGTDASFELDVDTTMVGIQTARGVNPGDSFNVQVLTNTTNSLPWEGYQVTLNYNDVTLDAVAPDTTWAAAPAEGTSGGNNFTFATGATCTPATQSASVFGEDDSGLANYAMTCTETTSGTTHTGEGALIQFAFTCEQPGTADFTISDIADTFLLDDQFNQFNNHVHNAQVTCAGTVPTDTPTTAATATNTPGPGVATATPENTNTPTRSPTPTRTPGPDDILITPTPRSGTNPAEPGGGSPVPPGTATPQGGSGGSISGPDTGDGTGSGGGASPLGMTLLAAGMLSLLVGIATPAARRKIARASRTTRGG